MEQSKLSIALIIQIGRLVQKFQFYQAFNRINDKLLAQNERRDLTIFVMKVFKLPNANSSTIKPSFLFMILDGTGSMFQEYDLMLEAYKNVFADEIKKKTVYAIQLGNKITSIEPFQGATEGNFNHAFQCVLQKLQQKLNADITICFVSDGLEESNIQALQKQINGAKARYQIQFTSIAVGKQYPFDLFQKFRDSFHNGTPSCPVVQFVDRAHIIGELFKFKLVKSQLSQQGLISLKQKAYQYIGALPSNRVQAGSIVLSEKEILETVEGKQIDESKNIGHVAELIQTSCQQLMVESQNNQFRDAVESGKGLKSEAIRLLQIAKSSTSQYTPEVTKVLAVIENDIQILTDIGAGRLQLDQLSNAQKTILQESFNPKKKEIQQAQLEQDQAQQRKILKIQLEKLVNEMSTQPSQMILLSVLSDYLDQAIQNKQSVEQIIKTLLDPNTQQKTLHKYAVTHTEWFVKFVDCYLKAT